MDLRVFVEPQQGGTYEDLLRVARATQELGFDGFFRSDHYLAMGAAPARPGITDAWTTLAGLARDTEGIALGTLVSAATFRLPGPLAISAAQVHDMSGGRVALGIGAAWYRGEHRAYGIPFPERGERFDRFEEQLAVLDGLLHAPATEKVTIEGKYYSVADAPGLAPSGQPRLPIIIGGHGKVRTPALAARYADEFNLPSGPPEEVGLAFKRVRTAAAGRSLVYSVAQTVCIGRDDAEVAQRAAFIGRDLDELRLNGMVGTPNAAVDRIGQFAELGATRVYLQLMDLSDLDHLELIASAVASQI